MLVHPVQQAPVVAAPPAPRKSLDLLPESMIYGHDDDETPSTSATTSPQETDAAFKTGQWCERNSVALLEACCNRDVTKGMRA